MRCAAIFTSLRCRRACWRLDANVPCGRASACSFAMLVLRCPASEKAALHSWPDNASLACLQYCIVHFSFLQTVTNVEFADLFSFLFPLLSFLHISSLGCPRISCILLFRLSAQPSQRPKPLPLPPHFGHRFRRWPWLVKRRCSSFDSCSIAVEMQTMAVRTYVQFQSGHTSASTS